MRSHRILQLNAIATAACAVGALAVRSALHPLFALQTPLVLDILAVGLLSYAGALAWAAQSRPVTRRALMLFTVVDGLWVAASAVVLVTFWAQLAPVARLLIIAVGIVVEVFATLQFRAASKVAGASPQMA
jgi:hypothetical protein